MWRVLTLVFFLTLLLKLCHRDVVWVEEAYPIAAALEMLRGKLLYRDIWFDKPPVSALELEEARPWVMVVVRMRLLCRRTGRSVLCRAAADLSRRDFGCAGCVQPPDFAATRIHLAAHVR